MFQKESSVINLIQSGQQLFSYNIMSTSFFYFGGGSMKQHTFKNVNYCLNTNIYSYLETSGGQSANPRLNAVHFFQHQS